MSREKIKISKNQLINLYVDNRLSPNKIGDLLNCSFSTITNRLREFGIPKRTKAQSHMKYDKKDFNGSKIEKSYLLGFRLGDLNVYMPRNNSETVIARCHTTSKNQVSLMIDLFKDYGKVSVSKSIYGYNVNCYLNVSFSFLIPKIDTIDNWIKDDFDCSAAFIAGYVDAEGNFILNQGRARFKLDTYDKGILRSIHFWLKSNNIRSILRLIAKKDQPRGGGIVFNNDLWRMNINEAFSVYRFIDIILPYLKHKKRRQDAYLMQDNINNRKKNKTI